MHTPAQTVVFILSTRRAGSTWLNLVLGSHSWAANLGECIRYFSQPDVVDCRQCEADGQPACTVLHGVKDVTPEEAFAFVASRIPRRVLIDATKRPEWCARFVRRGDIDARLIHLVRHPAGFMESEGRRAGGTWDALLDLWETENARIDAFVATSGAPHVIVSYEALAEAPERTFPALCAFAGGPFEPGALRYWEFDHHGLGANGAASLSLRGRRHVNYTTGDDAYYDSLVGTATIADTRWMQRVPPDVVRRAVASPYAAEMARRLGRPWQLVDGIAGAAG